MSRKLTGVVKEIPEGEWDIVFIDSFPIEERIDLAKKVSKSAKYVVVHDIRPGEYEGIFKYCFDYTKVEPNTLVFSNFNEISCL